jgi:putative heme-binding domain-containing protein
MVNYDHGSTGIAGISYYAADQFPAAYRGTVFIGNVVTNRINHDRIQWHGSSPKGVEQPDFVWSEDNWFRPVDIELGSDGALYVADFYNRIIGHYEVPLTHPGRDRERGRIWRIVYRGGQGSSPPAPSAIDRTQSTLEALIADLGHANLAVRISAANQLVERGGAPAAALVRKVMTPGTPARQRVHGLWVLQRRQALDDATLLACAGDPERELRVQSLKVLVERNELAEPFRELAVGRLREADPFVRRAAAEVLGAHPALANVRPLLALRQGTPVDDTHLIHVARMALRDQLKTAGAWQGLEALRLTERDRRDLADVAPGVHSPEAATYLLEFLPKYGVTPEDMTRFVHHIARYGALDRMSGLIAEVDRAVRHNDRAGADVLKAIHQGFQERGAPLDPRLRQLAVERARALLGSADPAKVDLGLDLASSLRFPEIQGKLREISQRTTAGLRQRTGALAALVAIDPVGNDALVGVVLRDAGAPLEYREHAAGLLATIDRPGPVKLLVETLPLAPERLQTAIAAGLARRREGAQALLEAIAAGKGSARLLQDQRVAVALKFTDPPWLEERLKSLLAGLPPADQKLNALLERRRAGFRAAAPAPEAGSPVFEKHCANCHQLGGKGAKVGPQLDGIGSRGLDRLVEDVLDPNRNVDQAFRVTNLALTSGQVVSGLLLREEGEVLVLADAQGKEVRVPKSSVEQRQTSPMSPMPANLADQIPEADFYRLLAYLLSKREPANPPPSPAAGSRSAAPSRLRGG